MTTTAHEHQRRQPDDQSYGPFLNAIAQGFRVAAEHAPALFSVPSLDLWELYLDCFPPEHRQTYTCTACREFVQRYGGLVTIDDAGNRVSAVWHPDRGDLFDVSARMKDRVERLGVTDVFVTRLDQLGVFQTGPWKHICVDVPARLQWRDRLVTAEQRAAHVLSNLETVQRALGEFSPGTLEDALRIFEGKHVARAEKFVGPLRWLRDLQMRSAQTRDHRKRSALQLKAVAIAPEGYCHPRASVIGPLLEGLQDGHSFDVLKERFQRMVDPEQYQRPQAPPKQQNVKRAETIVATLGLERAFERRFARLEEVECAWQSGDLTNPNATKSGIFKDVQTRPTPPRKQRTPISLPAITMTWTRFFAGPLGDARAIAFQVPAHGSFTGILTAVHSDAPPIMAWDRPEQGLPRNPFSTYVYKQGSPASRWGLSSGWKSVIAIVPQPNLWHDAPLPHHGRGYVLVLSGAVDRKLEGLALFPETLRNELHEVRATIEAFSERGTVQGADEASACGYSVMEGFQRHVHLRVTTFGGTVQDYTIDRWE